MSSLIMLTLRVEIRWVAWRHLVKAHESPLEYLLDEESHTDPHRNVVLLCKYLFSLVEDPLVPIIPAWLPEIFDHLDEFVCNLCVDLSKGLGNYNSRGLGKLRNNVTILRQTLCTIYPASAGSSSFDRVLAQYTQMELNLYNCQKKGRNNRR